MKPHDKRLFTRRAQAQRLRALPQGLTRRDFIGGLGAAGVAFGTPALMAGCGGGDDNDVATPLDELESRTLFFNFAHLGSQPTTQHLYVAGRKYTLTRVVDQPQVLLDARANNAFLRSVPDDQITHHVEGAEFSTVAPTLVYVSCNETPATGRWEMSSMFFNIPSSAMAHAYAHASDRAGGSTLAMSSKRRRYGALAAGSIQDLQDEHVLIDCTSHAAALVGVHPELLSLEPNSAAAIHTSYIGIDANTEFLGIELQGMGPAAPAGSLNVSGNPSWATLMPLMNTTVNPPVPFKKSDGQLDQFYPDWAPQVSGNAAQSIVSVQPLVRDDTTLGVDVTGYTPANPLPSAQAQGKVWSRHDGIATVTRSATATQSDAPTWTFLSKSSNEGLVVYDPTGFGTASGNRVQVTVGGVSNWYLRWLGMWLQFVRLDGTTVIPTASLPSDTLPDQPNAGSLDQVDAKFVGMLGPPTAFLGIPVSAGTFAPVVNIPNDASTMRVFYGGAGLAGSAPNAPAGITGVGIGMTVAVNYGLVGIFMAVGSSSIDKVIKQIVSLGAGPLAAELTTLIGTVTLDGKDAGADLQPAAMGALKILFKIALSKLVAELAEDVIEDLAEAEFIDAVPVAGQIARAVAAVVGALSILETTVEIALSPPVYQYDLVLTHSLAVKVLPDAANNQFPQVPSGYTLYYKVSYLFDQGTAHVQDAVNVDPAQPSIAISLDGIPRGGQVNVAIGFYARQSGAPIGQNDWCAGYGSTGLIDNTLDQAPPITITQTKVPIHAKTVYIHTRKTVLDTAGRHQWLTTATSPPYVMPPDGQLPGLGDFRGITVRQATSQPQQAGYVGYAWKAYSSGLLDCRANATGQLDQMANLNTDASDNGVHAQDGYAVIGCGLQAGARIAYNLLNHQARNFYLDSDTLHVRQVQLGNPTGFASPQGGQSFGRLNMDSAQLLLHPAGQVVSINSAYHKFETLRLPAAAVADDQAARTLLAQTHSGFGSRPGLMKVPVAAAITSDGAILVLESSALNNRLQAFDLGGNPLPLFSQQAEPHFLSLPVTQGAEYLDLAVEFTGYVYVLSKDSNGNHRLDIYHPEQTGTQPICTTTGINAARLAVDLWRSVYTLNYELLTLAGNGDVPQRSEPSVSLWVPPPPT